MGYASLATVWSGSAVGGYGVGSVEYAPDTVLDGLVTDAAIAAAVAATLPVTCTAWLRLT